MKKQKFSLILVAMLMMVQGIAQGQVKIYTKKARMDDFNTKTTKVVAAGQSITAMTLQKELEGRWLCSPYEICSESEYEELKSSNEYYFLYLSKENGIIFINLDKGGKKDDPDNKAKPFDVVRIPVAAELADGFADARFVGYALDVVQNFAEDAMTSDKVGYNGLKSYNSKNLGGRRVVLDEQSAWEALENGDANTLAGIVIAPLSIDFDSYCYKMLISTDTHELFYFKKEKYSTPADKQFTDKERNSINKRNGNIL